MYCNYCGAKLSDDSKFCSNCGKQIKIVDDVKEKAVWCDFTEETNQQERASTQTLKSRCWNEAYDSVKRHEEQEAERLKQEAEKLKQEEREQEIEALLSKDVDYQELCLKLKKMKRKEFLFWVIWIGIWIILLCFTFEPLSIYFNRGLGAIFLLLGYPVILGLFIIRILNLFNLRSIDKDHYTLEQEIEDYKTNIMNTYKKVD